MTFSIVARSDDGNYFGVAVASKFLAVGAAVPAARAGVGALATQAYANLTYRPAGLGLLAAGLSAVDVVGQLTGPDPEAGQRQLGVVGTEGDGATFTGAACHPWAGGLAGAGYAIQGNILTGSDVVQAMERAWTSSAPELPLATRLLGALAAGDEAGGDRRGRQSAALLVVTPGGGYGGGSDVLMDLRVDDHPAPVPELARLARLHELYFGRARQQDLLVLQGALGEEVAALLVQAGYPPERAQPEHDGTEALDRALAAWAGVENLEERLVPGHLDPLVLEVLRQTRAKGS
ncbi:MAG TPA: DUF1028 domain-containing protein [Acidimicrobiales bacterium]|nr:DUF1028 domain-containing protein [Acidimicrobiales bacterium]